MTSHQTDASLAALQAHHLRSRSVNRLLCCAAELSTDSATTLTQEAPQDGPAGLLTRQQMGINAKAGLGSQYGSTAPTKTDLQDPSGAKCGRARSGRAHPGHLVPWG
eukprot:CAMPEP_0174304552 /NCGR_PEP_ID=MMETSP0809-20121228/60861_1 /TAXON_ID=73025 ORGANISM="Eutreptiella gymnastica-like, Strain CCMP1594" /NCGR_SAMPLE_ID=MMETSP0809 /ASSEMBLY_ACC=CAM_ASM_000658 /LENGTH=106 /DNA_ID=CAMNT_0015410815 /DNA_START=834 /DNA_END=1154 /DNA_ORIENTATION=-